MHRHEAPALIDVRGDAHHLRPGALRRPHPEPLAERSLSRPDRLRGGPAHHRHQRVVRVILLGEIAAPEKTDPHLPHHAGRYPMLIDRDLVLLRRERSPFGHDELDERAGAGYAGSPQTGVLHIRQSPRLVDHPLVEKIRRLIGLELRQRELEAGAQDVIHPEAGIVLAQLLRALDHQPCADQQDHREEHRRHHESAAGERRPRPPTGAPPEGPRSSSCAPGPPRSER